MRRLLILKFTIIFFVLFFPISKAQLLDSIRSSLNKKTRIHFKLDNRNSFVENRRARISGIKVGVDFGKVFRVGGGINFLSEKIYRIEYLQNDNYNIDTLKLQLKLTYLSYYLEYVFYKTKRWTFSVPVQIGVGRSWYNHILNDTTIKILKGSKSFTILYEPCLSGQYKIFNWFGVGADMGFRYVIIPNKHIKEKFTSPIYVFKTLIFWDELYKNIFPNSKLAKK